MLKRKVFLISLLMLMLIGFGCDKKTPFRPDDPEKPVREYRDKALVTYTRDPAKILNPGGGNAGVYIAYELFDPDTKEPGEHEYIENNCRIGGVKPEKISEYTFQGYIKHVLIQSSPYHSKHAVYVQDPKLYDGSSGSSYTPYNIEIEGAYDIEIKHNKLFFKMSKN